MDVRSDIQVPLPVGYARSIPTDTKRDSACCTADGLLPNLLLNILAVTVGCPMRYIAVCTDSSGWLSRPRLIICNSTSNRPIRPLPSVNGCIVSN